MEGKGKYNGFDGAAWFDHQVRTRTRAALRERGREVATSSGEYQAEFGRQLALFRAERAEVKRRKKEKYRARMEKKMTTEQIGV